MQYADLQTALTIQLSQAPSPYTNLPADFTTLLPLTIEFAEDRILRDMVLLGVRTANSTLITAAASRVLNLSAMTGSIILIPEGVALITPTGTTNPALGTRVPYDLVSLDMVDLLWPTEATIVAPDGAGGDNYGRIAAMKDASTLVLGPTPGVGFTAEITGLFRPAVLSAQNTPTYISTQYPDLLVAACMIYLAGALLRNYGAASDDPKLAASWQEQYDRLLKAAIVEEDRRRTAGGGWSPNRPTPIATPPRP